MTEPTNTNSDSVYPIYAYHHAPPHLKTRRQLRKRGLRPGGQEPVAELRWYGGLRVAYLYDVHLALPVRPMTPRRERALAEAMRARRTCRACAQDTGKCIPRRYGICWSCVEADKAREDWEFEQQQAPESECAR
ncbi:RRQRL motif-containing zinc-binding protein [Embleya sp. NPDC050493]|uniref:RRQRL motif-containing zinc-binding protein n=1 Tax=Embleya sp. NPDC050493 TaxID=3363989 RepID=UPI003795DC27